MKLTIIPVSPIAREKTMAFVNPGGLREVEVDRYPLSPRAEAVFHFRIVLDVGMRELATALEMEPRELSALENGRATLSDGEWCEVFVVLSRFALKMEDDPRW